MTIAGGYTRYSSENQRPESIEDQVRIIRAAAAKYGFSLPEKCIYRDAAMSGALAMRPDLNKMLADAKTGAFQVLFLDDLSRLARDATLMLLTLQDLRYHGIRVISVADGLDTDDENSVLGIQVRGICNELQLADLRKKTFRGLEGQKMRGYFVGEATFGYRSEPSGRVRLDKHGRSRPEGYVMRIDVVEAEVVLRVFREYADGVSITRLVKSLNEQGVPGRYRPEGGWNASSIHRILENPKYRGHWIWNRNGNRRDLRTGRRKRYEKPESEWLVRDDEALRIVPQELWDRVQKRRELVKENWPGGSKGATLEFGRPGSLCTLRTCCLVRWSARGVAVVSVLSTGIGTATTVAWLVPVVLVTTR